jgi:hypothetical protein
LVNDSKGICTVEENKASAKGMFAKIPVPHYVRQRPSFEDDSFIIVGYSEIRMKQKLISEHMKLETSRRLQNSKRHSNFHLVLMV